MPDWIQQEYACCRLISYLNAALYYGKDVPRPGSEEFEALVDEAMCRHGSALKPTVALERFGLDLRPVDLHPENLRAGVPVDLTVWTPEFGFHSALLVEVGEETMTLVNLERGEAVSVVPLVKLEEIVGRVLGRFIQPYVAMSVVDGDHVVANQKS